MAESKVLILFCGIFKIIFSPIKLCTENSFHFFDLFYNKASGGYNWLVQKLRSKKIKDTKEINLYMELHLYLIYFIIYE